MLNLQCQHDYIVSIVIVQNVLLIVSSILILFAVWFYTGCQKKVCGVRASPLLPTEGFLSPHLPTKFKKNSRHLPPSVAPSSLSTSSLHHAHSSCVPKRSARLINVCLCVSCCVSSKALLAPLAQAAVRFLYCLCRPMLSKPKCAPFFN